MNGDEVIAALGVESADARRELLAGVDRMRAAGMEPRHVMPVAQAYVRALRRIVDAEVAQLGALVRETPAERRQELLDRLLPAVVGTSIQAFDVLHRSMLQAGLSEELALPDHGTEADAPMTVALVDLRGSTAYLATAEAEQTRALVDGLFEAGQGAAFERPVSVVKYVGDGFFLVGRDPREVAEACFDAVDEVGRRLPLRARAGIARGALVRRAGDLFGLPVNLAQLLTKTAATDAVLATDDVAAALPEEMRGASVAVAGAPGGAVALRRGSPSGAPRLIPARHEDAAPGGRRPLVAGPRLAR